MPTKTLEFLITLEDYPESDTCKVSLSSVGILQKLTVYDVMKRPLVLTVECVAKGKQAIEVQYLQYIVVQCTHVQVLEYRKCLCNIYTCTGLRFTVLVQVLRYSSYIRTCTGIEV